jgi:hypothetical protein
VQKVKTALAIVIGFISIIGSVAAYDARVAKQCDLEMLSSRLEQKIMCRQDIPATATGMDA